MLFTVNDLPSAVTIAATDDHDEIRMSADKGIADSHDCQSQSYYGGRHGNVRRLPIMIMGPMATHRSYCFPSATRSLMVWVTMPLLP